MAEKILSGKYSGMPVVDACEQGYLLVNFTIRR